MAGRSLRSSHILQTRQSSQHYPIPSASYSQPSTSSQGSSQRSQRSPQKLQRLSKDNTFNYLEVNHFVNKAIRYIVVLDGEKQVISKAQIIKAIPGIGGKNFHQIMNSVETRLFQVFGYKLIEYTNGKYILANQIENNLMNMRSSGTEKEQVLLLLVLSHIFMHGHSCNEESLIVFLSSADIPYEDDYVHPYFGNVKHLINEVFVAQNYLIKTNTDSEIEYRWGPRADNEFSPENALKFVSEVFDKHPDSWSLQYNGSNNH